jgi:4-hydroxy-tetrahydrodipicolinate synthase
LASTPKGATDLAEEARAPLFLYDHPQSTRVNLALDTVVKLSGHPNIRGIKCSDNPSYMRQLLDLTGDRFRVILAAPLLMDVFLRHGAREYLDGVFCLCPSQVVRIGRAAAEGNWQTAANLQQRLNALVRLLTRRPELLSGRCADRRRQSLCGLVALYEQGVSAGA